MHPTYNNREKWDLDSKIIKYLLPNYTHVNDNIYLRNDECAIAIITDFKNSLQLGFIAIDAKSRKEFTSTLLTLEDKALDAVLEIAISERCDSRKENPSLNELFPDIKKYLEIYDTTKYSKEYNTALKIRQEDIEKFISRRAFNGHYTILSDTYHFISYPCNRYANNTIKHKLKQFIKGTKKISAKHTVTSIIDSYSKDIDTKNRQRYQWIAYVHNNLTSMGPLPK